MKLGYTLEAQLSSSDGPINIEGVPQPQLGTPVRLRCKHEKVAQR